MTTTELNAIINAGFDTFEITTDEIFNNENLVVTRTFHIVNEVNDFYEVNIIEGGLLDIDIQNLDNADYDDTDYKEANENNRNGEITFADFLIQVVQNSVHKDSIRNASVEISNQLLLDDVTHQIRIKVANRLHTLL